MAQGVYVGSDGTDVWPPNTPTTLEDCCISFFVSNIFSFLDKTDDSYCLKPGITFPQGLSDKILQKIVNFSKLVKKSEDNVFGIFNNRATTSLTELPLRYTAVCSEELDFLCRHPVRKVDITYCAEIKLQFVEAINQASRTVQCLQLGGNDMLERMEFLLHEEEVGDSPNESGDSCNTKPKKTLLNLPNLRSLSLRDINAFKPMDGVYIENMPIVERLIRPLKSLTHLDLCECLLDKTTLVQIGNLELPNLISLNLCDTLNGDVSALENLQKLTTLRHLDISQADDSTMFLPLKYTRPTDLLSDLLSHLPLLQSLDISGTNLAGYLPVELFSHSLKPLKQTSDSEEGTSEKLSGLPGSNGRCFEFLGMLNCADDACQRKNIPATKVTGDANENQVILAVNAYRDKPGLLTRAFNTLFNRFRFETVNAHCAALEGILGGMTRNQHDRHVQISGSASLFYIVKGCRKHRITHLQKRQIIACLLDAMERHITEHTMMRNGCLTLCHFNIPNEVLYCYNRLVEVLLVMLRQTYNDDFLTRIGIFLLNSLACQVEGEHKQILGDMGIVEVMCSIIRTKLQNKICDEILEVCWSTLWNVTDETEPNCSRFMKQNGMYLFLDCFKEFPDKEELLRNMMGLMGNIAEVLKLRSSLMNSEYVTVFTNFLESTKDGIEVSYNAAGVLSHMLSDGEDEWTIDSPSRLEVVRRIVQAIRRWPLDSKRNINYRSFGPILQLVRCYQSHASQYWAVWALCNLTQVYPEKYIDLLKEEGGMDILDIVTRDPRPIDAIKQLATQVINFVNNYQILADTSTGDEEMNGNVHNGVEQP